MPSIVPSPGLQSYMEAQALTLTPANRSWKISNWFSTGPGAYVFMGALAAGALGSSFGPTASFVNKLVLVTIIPGLLLTLFITSTGRAPGLWQRYSLFQAAKKYPQLGMQLRAYILNIRKEHPDAEFEVAILEQREALRGAVLFQVGGESIAGETERVVQIFNDQFTPITFGEVYALPATP